MPAGRHLTHCAYTPGTRLAHKAASQTHRDFTGERKKVLKIDHSMWLSRVRRHRPVHAFRTCTSTGSGTSKRDQVRHVLFLNSRATRARVDIAMIPGFRDPELASKAIHTLEYFRSRHTVHHGPLRNSISTQAPSGCPVAQP